MKGRPVNLMPWRELRQHRCRRFWIFFLLLAGAGVALTTMGLQAGARLERQLSAVWLQADIQLLAVITARESHFKLLRQRWVQQQAIAGRRQMTRAWQARLSALAERLPDSAWLTTLHFRQGRLELAGLTRSFAALSEFEQALSAMHGFRLQPTGSMERNAQGQWQFHYQLDREGDNAP